MTLADRPPRPSAARHTNYSRPSSGSLRRRARSSLPRSSRELRRKRNDGTITSADLPGFLQKEFPGVLQGFSLAAIIKMCNYDKA